MSVPPVLNVHRHDTDSRETVSPTGEIDLSSAPSVHASPERRLHDGIRRPHARNRDVARWLQERLRAEHQASLGATLADRADRPVPAALRSRGWKDVGDIRTSADGAVFLALVLPLGTRTAARPAGLDHHAWTRWSP